MSLIDRLKRATTPRLVRKLRDAATGAVVGFGVQGKEMLDTLGEKQGERRVDREMRRIERRDAMSHADQSTLREKAQENVSKFDEISNILFGMVNPEVGAKNVGRVASKLDDIKFDTIPRIKFADKKLSDLQEQSIKQLIDERDDLIRSYRGQFGNIVNTDDARELFIGYNGINAAGVHEASSQLAKDVYRTALYDSDGKIASFAAGGSGAGKTSVLNEAVFQNPDVGVVFDGTLANLESSLKKIEEAMDAGKEVIINYVYRDPTEAWMNGVIGRAIRTRRAVPVGDHFKMHKQSMETVIHLADEYGIPVRVFDNSRGPGGAVEISIDELEKLGYTKNVADTNSLTKRAYEYTKNLIKRGEIDPELGRGLLEQ